MMPNLDLEDIFEEVDKCSENSCKVNRKNIKKVFKPDAGFKNKSVKNKLFGNGSYKICDCVVLCDNDDLIIIEILCGTLTHSELKEKKEQLENCCKVLKHINKEDKIKKVFLLYKKLVSSNQQPLLRKALMNPKICGFPLSFSKTDPFNIEC